MTKVDQVIIDAQRELGRPYVWGDAGPNSFDCSGLVQYVFAQVGITLPRVAADQQRATTAVSGAPVPGDLVFYGDPAYHVGLYLGAGKMIDAPHAGAVVRIEPVWPGAQYRRVGGLGAAAAPVVGTVVAAASTAGGLVSGILGPARSIVLEGTGVILGLALAGYGVYYLTKEHPS